MTKKAKKIVKIIIIVLVLLLLGAAIATYVIYRAAKSMVESNIDKVQEEFTKQIGPAREKLIKLCPPDYDKEKMTKAFDEFINASQEKRIRYMTALQELAPYLQFSLEDGKLTHIEADSVVLLLNKCIKTSAQDDSSPIQYRLK